ncbi:MAG: hypothetical protein FJZ09_05675 [Candidatus Omnitrophica bacterium]|nr:hypothetical protein [Candidatus Omnitrophota bacterium]
MNRLFYFIACILILIMTGCSTVKEAAKCVAGISTKELEDLRKDAIKKSVDLDYDICYNRVKRILKKAETYIYAEEPAKNLIAIYLSETDTTPVGIFITKQDKDKALIEVSGPSTFAKEFISAKIFDSLEKPLGDEKEEEKKEGEADAKKALSH